MHELLSKKTAKEQAKLDQYRSHGAAVLAQCEHMTKELCMQVNNAQRACPKMHKRCAGVQGARDASVRSVQERSCTGLGAAASVPGTDCGLMAWYLSSLVLVLMCRRVLFPWTDERLGNCRFLDSCNNTLKCK